MGRDLREKIVYIEKYCCRGGSSSGSSIPTPPTPPATTPTISQVLTAGNRIVGKNFEGELNSGFTIGTLSYAFGASPTELNYSITQGSKSAGFIVKPNFTVISGNKTPSGYFSFNFNQNGIEGRDYYKPTNDNHYVQKKYVDNFISELDKDKRLKFIENILNGAFLEDDNSPYTPTSVSKVEIDAESHNMEVGVVTRNKFYKINRQIANLTFYDNSGANLKIATNENVIVSVYPKGVNTPVESKFVKRALMVNKTDVENSGYQVRYGANDVSIKIKEAMIMNEANVKEVPFELDTASFPSGYDIVSGETKNQALSSRILAPMHDYFTLTNLGIVDFTLNPIGNKAQLYKTMTNKVNFLLAFFNKSRLDKMKFVAVTGGVETELPAPITLNPSQVNSIRDYGTVYNNSTSAILHFELNSMPDKILIKYKP